MPNMDGPEGSQHPYVVGNYLYKYNTTLAKFCTLHSRKAVEMTTKALDMVSNVLNIPRYNFDVISRLGVADKLAIIYTPTWMYCHEELDEYITNENNAEINCIVDRNDRVRLWKRIVDEKCHEFVNEWKHKAYALHQYKI